MLTMENVSLVVLLLLGLWARSSLVAAAAALLLVVRLAGLGFLLASIERRGVEVGLLFLTLAMLVPFARGQVSARMVVRALTSLPGIIAVVGGAL